MKQWFRKWYGKPTEQYAPLDPARKEIRILVNPKIDRRGIVNAKLETISLLGSYAEYEAISWVWGDTTQKREMILDGKSFTIPVNAEIVLRRLCVEQQRPRVWMDAVCMNMDNRSERNHQVAMMKDIYSSAKQVLIWLGEDGGFAQNAIDQISWTAKQCRDVTKGSLTMYKQAQLSRTGNDVLSGLPVPIYDWEPIKRFYSAPWFTRLWTIQEWFLSKRAVCYYSTYVIDYLEVACAAGWMRKRSLSAGGYTGQMWSNIGNAAMLYNLLIINDSKLRLDDLLMLSTRFLVTEPRDRIYGLFGIIDKVIDGPPVATFHPDYSKDVLDVYEEMTRAAITSRRSNPLGILTYSQCDTLDRNNEWPSWVLRRCEQRRAALQIRRNTRFRATGGIKLVYPLNDQRKGILAVQGLQVSSVTRCAITRRGYTEQSMHAVATHFLNWRAFLDVARLEGDEERRETKFALIMTAEGGLTGNDTIDVPVVFQNYRSFLSQCQEWSTQLVADPERQDKHPSSVLHADSWKYYNRLRRQTLGRRLFTTSNGSLGLGPRDMQEGDVVCILFGHGVPFVLRPDGDYWTILGEAYVWGIMEGEVVREFEDQGVLQEKRYMFHIH